MKKTVKKGFTLVELLVVIAILAILATVSVVGYTAFIERATVSNDENVAAQLNQFLTAMKADSTGPYYNKELVVRDESGKVDEYTSMLLIRTAVSYAVKDSGLNADGKLIPQSAEYGYHFSYNFEENQIVVVSEAEIEGKTSPLIKIIMLVKGEGETAQTPKNTTPATYISANGKYGFLDNDGSVVAQVIEGLFTLRDGAHLEEIKALVQKIDNEYLRTMLEKFIDRIIIVSRDGEQHYDTENKTEENKKADGLFIPEPSKTTNEETGETVEEPIKITNNSLESDVYPEDFSVPEHVDEISGTYGNSNVDFGDRTAEEIAGMVEENFTTGTITSSGKEYEIKPDDETTKPNVTNKEDATDKAEIQAKWELASFKILFVKDESKIRTKADNEYYAKYGETLKLYVEQTQNNINDPSREPRILTSFSGITFENNDYITIAEDGTVTWKKTPSVDNAEVKVKANSTNNKSNEITLFVDFSKSATLTVGANDVVGRHATVVFNANKDDKDTNTDLTKDGSFKLTASNVGYTYGVFTFDNKIVVSGGATASGETFCNINPSATENKTLSLTVNVNGVYTDKITVDLYDIGSLPVQLTSLGSHVGFSGKGNLGNDENTATALGDFFDIVDLPDGAELKAFTTYGDDKYNDLTNRAEWSSDSLTFELLGDENTKIEDKIMKFTGVSGGDAIVLAFVKDNVRISPDLVLNIVNGVNVKGFDATAYKHKDKGYVISVTDYEKLDDTAKAKFDLIHVTSWDDYDKLGTEKQKEFDDIVYYTLYEKDGKYYAKQGMAGSKRTEITVREGDTRLNDLDDIVSADPSVAYINYILKTGSLTEAEYNALAASDKAFYEKRTANNVTTYVPVEISADAYNLVPASEIAKYTKNMDITRDAGTGVATGNTDGHHKVTSSNIVLLGDYVMPKDGYIKLAAGKTIYGNMYTLDCSVARNNSDYIIGLVGDAKIQDIRIIAADYGSNVKDPWDGSKHSDERNYSSSVVTSFSGSGTAVISNAYIAGGRSPLRVRGAVTVEDTVLFGGAYANVDIQNSTYTITLKNVTTVNQGNVGNSRVGGGIVIATWKDDNGNALQQTTLKIEGDFKQYNFVGSNEIDKLMDLTGVDLGAKWLNDLIKNVGGKVIWQMIFPNQFNEGSSIQGTAGYYKEATDPFTFKYETGLGTDFAHWSETMTYRFYMNAGIMYLKIDNAFDDEKNLKLNIYCGETKSVPSGYGAASMSGMTAISTLNTFTVPVAKTENGVTVYEDVELNNNKDLIEAYRAEAINYMPTNCKVNTSTWEFVPTAPATGGN